MQKKANHWVRQKDPDLKLFLENVTVYLDIKRREAGGVHEHGGLAASAGQPIVGPRFYEINEVFLSTCYESPPKSSQQLH